MKVDVRILRRELGRIKTELADEVSEHLAARLSGEDALMTEPMVLRRLQVSRKTLWKLRSAKKFPAPLQPGGTRNLWRTTDVQRWIDLTARKEPWSPAPEAAELSEPGDA